MCRDGFSSAKLYQQRISRLHVVLTVSDNFSEKSELPKFILSAVSGIETKNLQRSE